MRKLTLAEANAFLTELMQHPEGETAILMRGKKPIAVILPVGDADLETVSLSFNPKFNAILLRSQRGKTYSHEEICREFGVTPFDPEKAKADKRKPKTQANASTGARKPKTKN
jgi:hypothetical protein